MSIREINNIKWAVTGIKRNQHQILPPDKMIRDAIEEHGENLTLGWSGGRCSTVCLHKALKIKPDIKVIYCNTGIEFPENVEYVHTMKAEPEREHSIEEEFSIRRKDLQ